MIEFNAHDYQQKIITHIGTHPRANVYASPGMGKTASTLIALRALALTGDVFPALVVGPLRVANSVWNREVAKWAQLEGLRVVKILGTVEERLAALKTPGDIYTIHYGLLTWLHEVMKGAPWPFKTIVADESTRIKSQRCSFRSTPTGKTALYIAGAVNAAALMRYAPRTPHWINLTGTPAPNGLKDLWGQHWPIDFGASLGRTYDAFSKRWFMQRRGTTAQQAVFDPLPHAFDEITERIAPTTISLDAYDYFDVDKPREVDIRVDLTEKDMKAYRKLHREAVIQLANQTVITAVNAGVITNKCLQFASGHVFDDNGVAHHVHDAKLDALDSLVENLNGAPLLIAYAYKPDRDAILKRFPHFKLLPSGKAQQAVEDDWNAGRIPGLVVHPASAGHGLSLQHGGCDLCIYSPNWDAELYEQIIERIGPVRQMQSGYKRIVSVYRLITHGTFDTVTTQRVTAKISVQQAIKGAMA
jgi:SNF2 family DNA or RNA helicase